MKLTIQIDDQEVLEAAKAVVIERVADRLYGEYNNSQKYNYKTVIKECVREAIKGNIDDLSDRVVSAAAKTIENRAVKKMLDKLKDEM